MEYSEDFDGKIEGSKSVKKEEIGLNLPNWNLIPLSTSINYVYLIDFRKADCEGIKFLQHN